MADPTTTRQDDCVQIDVRQLDEWCRTQCRRLMEPMTKHLMGGRSLDDPAYRVMLGKHSAYMTMRSYIAGHLRTQPSGAPRHG